MHADDEGVSRVAGVSVMTVSRAFRRDGSVGEETRKRIRAAADVLGYVFDSTAANLGSPRGRLIAVTIPSLNDANFAATVQTTVARLSGAGYQVLPGHSNDDARREAALIEQVLGRRPEAVVVTGGHHTARARRLLTRAAVPVVEPWDLPGRPIGHVVGFSNAACAELLVAHLVAQGLSRTAYLGGDADGDARGADRRRGFMAAMAHLPDARPDRQGVIRVSDLAAFGALTECQRRGVAVPDQMAIAGFGAYDISDICIPTLTTVDPRPAKIGDRAAALVLDQIGADGDAVARGGVAVRRNTELRRPRI